MELEVLLTGSFGVGKSSIFNRFIYEEFSNKYYGTLGARVNEKTLEVLDTKVKIKLWDIAGEVNQNRVPTPYFRKKDVILYVIDLTRPFSFEYVERDLDFLMKNTNGSIIKIVGSKKDLFSDQKIHNLKAEQLPISLDWLTSAKNGENIEEVFIALAEEHISTVR